MFDFTMASIMAAVAATVILYWIYPFIGVGLVMAHIYIMMGRMDKHNGNTDEALLRLEEFVREVPEMSIASYREQWDHIMEMYSDIRRMYKGVMVEPSYKQMKVLYDECYKAFVELKIETEADLDKQDMLVQRMQEISRKFN